MTTPLGDPAPAPTGGRAPGRWYAGPVPERRRADGFVFTRLTAAHAELDHAALMGSVDYLRMWSDSEWPTDDFTLAENRVELAWHDDEHGAGIAFTYSVQDAVESRVLGCLYLRPLSDMLLTRGVEPPAGPSWPDGDTPCARGWLRRDEPEAVERRFLGEALTWLTGPAWAFPSLWWVSASSDARQLELLGELGWSRELRASGARDDRDWVLRARTVAAPPSGEASHHDRQASTYLTEEDHMKSLSCREMGVECPFRAEGETGEEVKAKMLKHAAAAHVGQLMGMTGAQRTALLKTLDEKVAAL